ncbi:NrfD/PsrC family molybdoenzyme membrane anchor subunit [Tepidibacillus sp. HK-1]|uniref:NrfD/PsrC family molybdoenzyme membrane anchor subunit n=1 Tax=Tepidibacillus sp. HK-1 TaxID=1883407 RepID=UPI000853C9DF|nr:NrfD/PsrC family molybdoenzyme membrane anchor subunit [Tepidibacillus sp. HK-1]
MQGYIPWDYRITIDLFLGGLGIGVFLLSIILSFYNKEQYEKLIRQTAYLAPILVGGGLLFLISELGRPERFITTMYRFNPHSVTSWGGVIQGIFVLLSLIHAFIIFKKNTKNPFFKPVQIAGAIFAIGVGIYHGLLLTSLDRPLWNGGVVTLLFLVSSLLGGTAIVIILKSFYFSVAVPKDVRSQVTLSNEGFGKNFNFTYPLFFLSGLQIILVIIWQVTMYRSGQTNIEAFKAMMDDYSFLWWGIAIVVGLIIPFIGGIYQLAKNHKEEMANGLALTLSIFILVGSAVLKHILLQAGQISIPFFL